MASNDFSKEQRVAFDEMCAAFEDALILSKAVDVYSTDSRDMERANNIIWRPMPYIAQSFDGSDQTANFSAQTQLSVPASLGFRKAVPWVLTDEELRDAQQEGRIYESSKQKLASDINLSIQDVVADQGTLVVDVSTAAGDFDDIALCDSIMNEQGVPMDSRYIALSSRSANGLANNITTLAGVSRDKGQTAYDRAVLSSNIAGFTTLKLDYAKRIRAETVGSLTMDTQASAGNYHTPSATRTASTGESSNVDNRYQQVTISATTNVVAGDCFTIAGVNAVHHITKQSTGQLKTFRVISVDSGTTMTISPAIISNQGATDAEAQYQNVSVTESATAALVWLNTTAADINPFWRKDSIELLPGNLVVDSNSGAGVMRATTAQGIDLLWTKQYDINTGKTKIRVETFYGVCNKNPEMNGILLFGQA
jgi:hypothetical protein